MAGITPEIIRRVKEENGIADVISGYLTLKKSGRNLVAPCPFHQEKTPSFVVTPEKEIFHCFGCGVGGDVISFIRHIENLDFSGAVTLLARRAGIQLDSSPGARAREEEKARLLQVNQAAADFFHARLLDSPAAGPARAYLAGRRLSPETVARFRLGYAPEPAATRRFLLEKGFAGLDIERAGLRFNRRLVFPIFNLSDECVGFGARALDDSQPKYLNTAENEVFRKGSFLYGLNLTRRFIQDENLAVLVEGYMDLVKLFQAGVRYAVAGLGTALTPAQARTIKRFTGRVTLFYDGDEAGQRAVERNLEAVISADLETGVAVLPPDSDPDSYVDRFGAGALGEMIGQAGDPLIFVLERINRRTPLRGIAAKISAARQIFPLVQALPGPLKRSAYLTMTAQHLDLSEEALRREFQEWQAKNRRPWAAPEEVKKEPACACRGVHEAERLLLGCALADPGLREQLVAALAPEDFSEDAHREIFELLCALPAHAGMEEARGRMPGKADLVDGLYRLAVESAENGLVNREGFDGCLRRLIEYRVETRQKNPLKKAISDNEAFDPEALGRFQALIIEKHSQNCRD